MTNSPFQIILIQNYLCCAPIGIVDNQPPATSGKSYFLGWSKNAINLMVVMAAVLVLAMIHEDWQLRDDKTTIGTLKFIGESIIFYLTRTPIMAIILFLFFTSTKIILSAMLVIIRFLGNRRGGRAQQYMGYTGGAIHYNEGPTDAQILAEIRSKYGTPGDMSSGPNQSFVYKCFRCGRLHTFSRPTMTKCCGSHLTRQL